MKLDRYMVTWLEMLKREVVEFQDPWLNQVVTMGCGNRNRCVWSSRLRKRICWYGVKEICLDGINNLDVLDRKREGWSKGLNGFIRTKFKRMWSVDLFQIRHRHQVKMDWNNSELEVTYHYSIYPSWISLWRNPSGSGADDSSLWGVCNSRWCYREFSPENGPCRIA